MDMETSDAQDVFQEDTLMEVGRAVIHNPIAEHPRQPATLSEHDATSADNNTMDIDSHMGEVPKATSINSFSESYSSGQSSLVSTHPEDTVNTNSGDGSTVLSAASVSSSNLEDRIDAALAGKTNKDDGYESSDLESSDDDDDGPESSDSDSDMEAPHSAMTVEQREKALIEIDEMDEEDDTTSGKILHTANEIVQLPEVKKPEIVLGPGTVLDPIGTLMSIVDNVVVVQAASSGEVRVLDAGTVAAIMGPKNEETGEEQREVLGEIFETFGPVARPLYSIRFNTAAEIPEICTVGCRVYSVPEYSSFVLTGPLKALKGSDASNKFDEEVQDSEIEFSDDEKEIEHNRMLKQRRKQKSKKERKVPGMAADTSAAMQAMMGQVPTSTSSTTRTGAPQGHRKPIALPRKPIFNDPEDGYRILQRPGDISDSQAALHTEAGTGTIPWYRQQQRELQSMIGTQQQQSSPQQQLQKEQDALLQFQKQQQIRQELLLQQQQQQQLFQQQQQQQEAYQKQIQEAQATILRLQQQQQQLQQQQQQSQQLQQPVVSHQVNASFNPQQAHLQSAGLYTPQQPNNNSQQQQIANLLSPLFHPTQNQPPQ